MKHLWLILFVSFLFPAACDSKSDSKSPTGQIDSDKEQNEKSLSSGEKKKISTCTCMESIHQ